MDNNDMYLRTISSNPLEENSSVDDVLFGLISKDLRNLSDKFLATRRNNNDVKHLKNSLKHGKDKVTEFAFINPTINKLLNRFRNTDENLNISEKLQSVCYDYQKNAKVFLTILRKILKSNLEIRRHIHKAEKEFRLLSLTTSSVNILSWMVDIMMVLSMPIILKYSVNPRTLILLSSITGSLSMFGSFFAFSHAKHKVDEISRILKQDQHDTMELLSWYSNSLNIDTEICQLFPHGIDHELIDRSYLDGNKTFESELSWKQYLCSILILSNIEKDAKMLTDEDFLTTVKLFIESSAAHIWWNRLKIHKLMESNIIRTSYNPVEVLTSCCEFFQNRAVLSLFPLTIPLLIAPAKQEKTRIILGALGAALAVFDLLESKGFDEFDEIKRMLQAMKKEYTELKKICLTFDTEYD